MSRPFKELIISLAAHVGLVAFLVSFSAHSAKPTTPVVIDLTLNNYRAPERPAVKSRARQVVPPLQAAPPPASPARPVRVRPEPQVQPAPVVSRQAAPAPAAPVTAQAVVEAPHQVVTVLEPSATPAMHGAGSEDGRITAEKAQQRYVKEQYTYIHDLIVRRLVYPQAALRMGWSGRVVLSFVVAENGSVRSLQVKVSSGYPVLDARAVDTVRQCVPFPRPPVAAEIIMPVLFKLQ
ncbi:energy transducer TonB [Geobacter sp. AOG2]|uniref:energy transducer TonB n=1 Tax=Geobacter sp. AOG2 TaxID=1566347 RepID=UPI001CC53FA7|nr:energy transducer TonB [Geobacter sp. AOG2]GFE61896.1 hypothetical protein AOG2_24840 [Geobacter sp. AOG2]